MTLPVEVGLRDGAGCDHPEDQRERAMLGDPETSAYCRACRCVLELVDGVWTAQPTGITKVTTTR